MKCSHCGSEIELGCVYCSNCGKEAMIVSDLNVFEDEVLRDILDEEALEKRKLQLKEEQEKKKLSQQEEIENNKSSFQRNIWDKTPRRILFILLCIALVIAIAVIIVFALYKHNISIGRSYDNEEEYEEAVNYYAKAINLNSFDTEARVLEANDYINLAMYSQAEDLLLKAKSIDSTNEDVIKGLIRLYSVTNNKIELNKLKSSIKDEDLLALFDSCVVSPPTFSDKAGKYDKDLELELKASSDCKIYYTLDGTNPSTENGQLYTSPIELSDGLTVVKAIAVNSDGYSSLVVSGRYKVSYTGPEDPVISPDGGSYSSKIMISISSSEDCEIYYTWDNTIPTADSHHYTGEFPVKKGNNILSVIAIDKHDMTSRVVRANFDYEP